jgi:hypothetical protein
MYDIIYKNFCAVTCMHSPPPINCYNVRHLIKYTPYEGKSKLPPS